MIEDGVRSAHAPPSSARTCLRLASSRSSVQTSSCAVGVPSSAPASGEDARCGSAAGPSGSVGDARGRRSRVRRRRGVRQRLSPGPHRARGLPHDALHDRDPQHRPLGPRGLREPVRTCRARGSLAGGARGRALCGSAYRPRGDRRFQLVRRGGHPGGRHSQSACRRRRPEARATSSPTLVGRSSRVVSSTTCTSSSPFAATVSGIEADGFEIEGTRVSFAQLPRGRRCSRCRADARGEATSRRRRRARPPRPPSAWDRRRRARLRPRVLPQARNQARAGTLELPRRGLSERGKRLLTLENSLLSVLGCARRGDGVAKARRGGGWKSSDRRLGRALLGAVLVSSSAGQNSPPGWSSRGSPPGLDKAIAAKRKHADRLLEQPGVWVSASR